MSRLKSLNCDPESVEELLYAQRLGGNTPNTRTKAVKDVGEYFYAKSSGEGFTANDLMKIWKGLYYCMYMADKLLFQENVAEDISCLIKSFSTKAQQHLYFYTAMKTFAREWSGMDNFRADKFMMLMRRILRQVFICLRDNDWNEDEVNKTVKTLEDCVILPSDDTNSVPMGMKYHLVDILLEELAKIGGKDLPHSVILSFIYPYMKVMAVSRQNTYVTYVKKSIFQELIQQSELGVEHEQDLDYGEYAEVLGDDEREDVEVAEVELDPRAGSVDVFLPTLHPDFGKIAIALQSLGSLKEINSKKRKIIYSLVKNFQAADAGSYPFAPPTLKINKRPFSVPMINDAMTRLKYHDQELLKKEDPNHLDKNRKAKLKIRESMLGDNEIKKPAPMPAMANETPYKRKPRKRKGKKTKKTVDPEVRKRQGNLYSRTVEKAVNANIEELAETIGLPKSVISHPSPLKKPKRKKKKDFFCELSAKDFVIESKFVAQNVTSKHILKVTVKSNVSDVKESLENGAKLIKSKEITKKNKINSPNETNGTKKKKSMDIPKGTVNSNVSDVKELLENGAKPKKYKEITKKNKMNSPKEIYKINLPNETNGAKKRKSMDIPKVAVNSNISDVKESLEIGATHKKFKEITKKNKMNSPKEICKINLPDEINGAKKKKSMEKSTRADVIMEPETPNNKILKQKKSTSKNRKRKLKEKLKNEANDPTPLAKLNAKTSLKLTLNDPTPLAASWPQPLKEGEFEYDVKKSLKKKKEKMLKNNKLRSLQKSVKVTNPETSDKIRKLKIDLLKNKEHELLDYRRVLQSSPAIPYSAEKKPRASALKPTDSPILVKKSFKLKRLR